MPSRPLFALSDRELAAELDEVFAAEQRLAARRLALLAEIDARGVAMRDGARHTGVWLGERLRLDAGQTRQWLRLARALSTQLPATAQALADGQIHQDQAQVIERAISHLPDSIDTVVRGQAEQALIGFAGTFAPSPLAALGGRILGHVAPEVAEEHERRQLQREEARAWQERCFHLTPHGPARHRLSGWLDNESAATVNAALDALCRPPSARDSAQDHDSAQDRDKADPGNGSDGNGSDGKGTGNGSDGNGSDGNGSDGEGSDGNGTGSDGEGSGVDHDGAGASLGQQRADALVQLSRMALQGGSLPTHGGQRPQVIVTMPFEPWQNAVTTGMGTATATATGTATGTATATAMGTATGTGMGTATGTGMGTAMGTLADGRKVTPETLRRMACDAELTPVVLGGHGEVLDVGRAHRLVTPAIRKALHIRDRGCCFPGCDRPAAWTEAHHRIHWVDGGVTSLDTCLLLCRKHHVIIHEGQWQIRLGPDRLPEFIPPSYVDPEQRPRRNVFHQRA